MSARTEVRVHQPPASLVAAATISGMAAYQALVDEANADFEGYWGRLAREFVSWKTPFTKCLTAAMHRCASGCCHCPSRCACCWPHNRCW